MSRPHGWGGARPLRTQDRAARRKHPLPAPRPGAGSDWSFPLTDFVRAWYNQGATPSCAAYSTCQLGTIFNGRMYDAMQAFLAAGGAADHGIYTNDLLDLWREQGLPVVPEPYPQLSLPSVSDTPKGTFDVKDHITGYQWFSKTAYIALDQAVQLNKPFLFAFPCSYVTDTGGDPRWLQPRPNPADNGVWHQVMVNDCSVGARVFVSPNNGGIQPPIHIAFDTLQMLFANGAYGVAVTDWVSGDEVVQPSPAPDTGFTCRVCGETFPTKRERRRHKRKVHGR